MDKGLALSPGTFPFTSRSEHNDQFHEKPRMGRPVEPLTYTHKPAPWMGHQTSNQATFKPFTYSTEKTASPGRPVHAPPADMPFDYSTTHRTQFVPKGGPRALLYTCTLPFFLTPFTLPHMLTPEPWPQTNTEAMGREPTAVPELRPQQPWMASGTTYGSAYVPKEFALQPVGETHYNPYPFDGTSEYRGEYVPKEPLPQVPPLTGIVSRDGLQLPLPRRSLGVEYWHKGKSDQVRRMGRVGQGRGIKQGQRACVEGSRHERSEMGSS